MYEQQYEQPPMQQMPGMPQQQPMQAYPQMAQP